MKLRGYGDLLGFKQSGIKNFRLADPILNEDLFLLAEKEIKRIEANKENLEKLLDFWLSSNFEKDKKGNNMYSAGFKKFIIFENI